MPDGVRTLVVGGTRSQNDTTAVPSVEIYNTNQRGIVSMSTLAVLQRFRNFILYPLGEYIPANQCLSLSKGNCIAAPAAVHFILYPLGELQAAFQCLSRGNHTAAVHSILYPVPGG